RSPRLTVKRKAFKDTETAKAVLTAGCMGEAPHATFGQPSWHGRLARVSPICTQQHKRGQDARATRTHSSRSSASPCLCGSMSLRPLDPPHELEVALPHLDLPVRVALERVRRDVTQQQMAAL